MENENRVTFQKAGDGDWDSVVAIFRTQIGNRYYHSETGGFYPYPWNHYVPTMGYYGGSRGWTGSPHRITNGISSVPRPMSAAYQYSAPLPNIPPPAPRPSQIQNYRYSSPRVTAPVPATTSATVSTSTSASKPTSSPGVRSGGFGSSGSSAVS